jgi:competence protein ComEC
MAWFGLCVLAGAYALQFCSDLPGPLPLAVLAVASIAALVLPRIRLLAAFLSGFVLLAIASQAVIDDRLLPELAGERIKIDARVADFPKDNGVSLRFPLEPLGRDDLPGRIRVSWFDAPVRPNLGETWQFELRLRRPRGFSNPGGFDYEGWLFRRGIGATGYVINGRSNLRRDNRPIDRVSLLRQRLVFRIRSHLPDDEATSVLMAVGVGARYTITTEQWKRYAATGTSHLMAISGLHIGLAAGGMFFLSWFVLSLVCRNVNIRDRAAVVAAVAAYAYAEISGFAVPARRAVLMTIVFVLAGLLRRQVTASQVLAICCLGIMLSAPLAILAPGFKLSFAAVAILFWHLRVTQIPSRTTEDCRFAVFLNGLSRLTSTQFALLFGLLPFTVLLFHRVAILAPVVNLVALPIFNLVTVPACLLGLMLDGSLQPAGDFALSVAHRGVGFVLWIVNHAAELPFTNFSLARPKGLFIIAVFLPSLWVLTPPGWPGRKLALVAALATILYRPPPPPDHCLDLHVLDVGQGLALVIRTHRHTAVYDTGPSFRSGSDTGQLVLIPFLRSEGVRTLDALIVSHADQDHAGGVQSLVEEMQTGKVLSGETLNDTGLPQRRCLAPEGWTWDGVEFKVVHPADENHWQGNNASCVLEVRVARHTVLLTGDIESPVEALLTRSGVLSPASIALVPHHGSRTSSSDSLVDTIRPQVAIVSAGFENRWGFPKADISRKWKSAGAQVLNTANSGAISFRVCPDEGVRRLSLHRQTARKYWH